MPPAAVAVPNCATSMTPMPATPAEIVPELLMPPRKLAVSITAMPVLNAVIWPELLMLPAKVDTLAVAPIVSIPEGTDQDAESVRRYGAAIGNVAGEGGDRDS